MWFRTYPSMFYSGETVAIVGESGSGKSVTALSIMQLLPYPSAFHPSGSIRYNGQELVYASKQVLQEYRGDRIGMIFQEPQTSLNPFAYDFQANQRNAHYSQRDEQV